MITGNKIRIARHLRKITVKEMAAKLDMDDSTYSRLERGETRLTEDRVERILQALEMSREFVEQLEEHINFNNTYTDNPNGNFVNTQYADFTNKESSQLLQQTIELLQKQIENQNKLIEAMFNVLSNK